jgi:hypothetical protein
VTEDRNIYAATIVDLTIYNSNFSRKIETFPVNYGRNDSKVWANFSNVWECDQIEEGEVCEE